MPFDFHSPMAFYVLHQFHLVLFGKIIVEYVYEKEVAVEIWVI